MRTKIRQPLNRSNEVCMWILLGPRGKKVERQSGGQYINQKTFSFAPPTATPLPQAIIAAYSRLTASQPSIQLGGRPPDFQRAKWAQAAATREERNDGLLQGPDESIGTGLQLGKLTLRAKLLGNKGFPGERSPTGSYPCSFSLSPKSEMLEGCSPSR